MKTLIALLILSCSVFAATPVVITVDESGGVFKDGVNTNMDVADFIANNPTLSTVTIGAFRERVIKNRDTVISEKTVARASVLSETQKETARSVEITKLLEENAKLKARIAELEAKAVEK